MTIKIVQGATEEFVIRLRDEFDDPVDLNAFDNFLVCLGKSDGTFLNITEIANANGSVVTIEGDPLIGKLRVKAKAADTVDLRSGERQDIFVELDNSGSPDPKRKKVENILDVSTFDC